MLDRQYFMGPVWDGKEKPKSIMNDEELLLEYLETLNEIDADIDVRKLAKGKDKSKGFKEVQR